MKSKTILVTGGTGYIGSHTVVELINKGYEVIIADNLSSSRRETLQHITSITGKEARFEEIDLRDKDKLEKFIKSVSFQAVIHFAAHKSVGESVQNPLEYYDNNVSGMIHLLRCLNPLPKTGFVFSSSCTVYGNPASLPVSEQAPTQKAVSPYGNTKKICEEILEDAAGTSSLQCISLRYFNPIGAHESALIGEYPVKQPNNLVPGITETAIGKRKIFNVFGNDYNTPDGTCIRDYIHVVDVAIAHVAAIERLINTRNKKNFEIFNLGTGKGNSVMEVIKEFEIISGMKLNFTVVSRRPGDAEQIYADTALANKELNWKAERSLSDMLSTAWKWEQKLAGIQRNP